MIGRLARFLRPASTGGERLRERMAAAGFDVDAELARTIASAIDRSVAAGGPGIEEYLAALGPPEVDPYVLGLAAMVQTSERGRRDRGSPPRRAGGSSPPDPS